MPVLVNPASRDVFEAGRKGRLRAAVKWGAGVDNIDIDACKDLSIHFTNTPGMFGNEVADIAFGYIIALARETFEIDHAVREGEWFKPRGISLAGKTVAVVGYGDIGSHTAKRLIAADMQVIAYNTQAKTDQLTGDMEMAKWPDRIEEADFIVMTCSLTPSSRNMIDEDILARVKSGIRIVNVARGGVIKQSALEDALDSGKVYSAALDVFEVEPLPLESPIRDHPHCIFGSHNASNTTDAVQRTSEMAINLLFNFLGIHRL